MHASHYRTNPTQVTSPTRDPHAVSAHLIASLEKELIRYMQQRYGQPSGDDNLIDKPRQ